MYLTTISRVKQHLYRVHKRLDNCCLSCFEVFTLEQLLSAHNRARPSCEVQATRFEEKLTTEQVKFIKRRSLGRTLEETWFAIFKILFPGSPLPTSPFVDSVSADAVQNFADHFFRQARARLSRLVRAGLEGRMLLEGDQQRILDSALESAIARLVWQTDPRRENSDMLPESTGDHVQHRGAEDHTSNPATEVQALQVVRSPVPIEGSDMFEVFLNDSWQSQWLGDDAGFGFGIGGTPWPWLG